MSDIIFDKLINSNYRIEQVDSFRLSGVVVIAALTYMSNPTPNQTSDIGKKIILPYMLDADHIAIITEISSTVVFSSVVGAARADILTYTDLAGVPGEIEMSGLSVNGMMIHPNPPIIIDATRGFGLKLYSQVASNQSFVWGLSGYICRVSSRHVM